jgi:threonine synthase
LSIASSFYSAFQNRFTQRGSIDLLSTSCSLSSAVTLDHECLREAKRAGAEATYDSGVREFPTVVEIIGNTPIVRLPRLQPQGGARLLVKLEYLNPGGSIKDRIGQPMIDAAERDGLLKPGGTIVEPTSAATAASS